MQPDETCPSCGGHVTGLAPVADGPEPIISSSNPFASSAIENVTRQVLSGDPSEGRFGLGLALGLLLGFWGLVGCLIFGEKQTKRGAAWGFAAQIGLTFALGMLAAIFT